MYTKEYKLFIYVSPPKAPMDGEFCNGNINIIHQTKQENNNIFQSFL